MVSFTGKSRQKIVAIEFAVFMPEFWGVNFQPQEQLTGQATLEPSDSQPLSDD